MNADTADAASRVNEMIQEVVRGLRQRLQQSQKETVMLGKGRSKGRARGRERAGSTMTCMDAASSIWEMVLSDAQRKGKHTRGPGCRRRPERALLRLAETNL
jgi:hypothetical protein